MKKNKTSPIEQFKELLGYGHFRPYKKGFEVRVNDLDTGFARAIKIIEENKLPLLVSDKDTQLRSFVVTPTFKNT